MERLLKVIRLSLAGLIALTVLMIWFENGEPVMAESQAARRLGGQAATLSRISLTEFQQAGLADKIREVAELDDVRITCDVTGMLPILIDGINVKDGVSELERAAMLYNSWALQNVITCAAPGTAIYLPMGTFYFVSGHLKMAEGSRNNERHVIKPADGVSLVGVGANENGMNTTLKVYSQVGEFTQNAKAISLGENGFIEGGVDMFFYNDYSAYGFPNQNERDIYLDNVGYYDFIINSEDSSGARYNTSGKGFMINLFRNCVWDNVVVKNTDGTGFGVDAPVNGVIKNSRAEGCGKGATIENGGASGFGIGTGYADNESMLITNSVAINNKKFGFFYEHQGRFGPGYYTALSAANQQAFRVTSSYAEGNLYNYGGLRANDVYYENSTSVATGRTVLDVYFSDESRRVAVNGIKIERLPFDDVDSSAYYARAIEWAATNGISNGVGRRRFGVGQTVRRADAIVLLWRMAGRAGDVLALSRGTLTGPANRIQNIDVCFADVPSDAYYAAAVQWAYERGITNGTRACSSPESRDGLFGPERGITRAEFVTMLWRMAGSPVVGQVQEFSDVTSQDYYYNAVRWAAARGITSGIGGNKFGPDYDCTREQTVTLLWRYSGMR